MSTLILAPIVLLVILFVIGTTVGVAARRVKYARSDHYHWVARVLCAVLALAALAAVGVGTWRGAIATLTPEPVGVSLPTRPPQPLPKAKASRTQVDLGPSKLVGTVLLVRKLQDRLLPICGESRSLDWPTQGAAELVFQGESGDCSYKVRMDLSEFGRWNANEELRVMRGVEVQRRGTNWSSSGGLQLNLDTFEMEDFGNRGDMLEHSPLSLIPVASGRDLFLLVHLTRADRDDPLRQMSASQWLGDETKGVPRNLHGSGHSGGGSMTTNTPPGIQMAIFLGPSVWLLLLAAAVGSGLFRRGRRALGFAGLMVAMVLYAGLLDAVVMQHRARVASEVSQPESVRLSALENLRRGTFFHAGRAAETIRKMAADPSTPPALRAAAEALGAE